MNGITKQNKGTLYNTFTELDVSFSFVITCTHLAHHEG